MKIQYKQKLSLYYFIIFALFSCGIIIFERSQERKLRSEALEEKLDAYSSIIAGTIGEDISLISSIDSIARVFPENLRITIIDRNGNVLYDRSGSNTNIVWDNHSTRPEIAHASAKGKGTDIRRSSSNDKKYLYYAKRYNRYYVRVAFPYDVHLRNFLKSDNLFLYFIIGLFLISLFFIRFVADRFGNSIKKLKEFATNGITERVIEFPNDELGEIGKEIMDRYRQLDINKKLVDIERDKLLQHVHTSGEGLCFFAADKTPVFFNGLFIQYLNIITDEAMSEPQRIFTDKSFETVNDFLSAPKADDTYFETRINKQGKTFNIMINIFEDGSFEINIADITKQEKTRKIKQEMTSNIAHELRTPVTSIRGYLELALGDELSRDKEQLFISKAYNQTLVLSELIQDMSLLTKIEDGATSFAKESVSIERVISDVKDDFGERLAEKRDTFKWEGIEGVSVNGNYNLLYSIFRNLTDNALRYAGENINITVTKYNEDRQYFYFSFSDDGVGIPDEHLNRLFERFYRVNEGRSRDSGGSGLGLSIVKNAIAFHGGTVVAKNRVEGGLEFLFTLQK